MIIMSIKVEAEKFMSILAKFPVESAKIFQTETNQWAIRTSSIAKARAPYRTGHLAQSIMAYKSAGAAEVSANVDYAQYVEPEPLGVPMTRNMTRTQFLYNSAVEEANRMVERIAEKLLRLFEG